MTSSAQAPLTLHQRLLIHVERRIRSATETDAMKIPEAMLGLNSETARLEKVLRRLDEHARQKLILVMTKELDIFTNMFVVAAADIITEPMREAARRTGDEGLLDQALELFNQLVQGQV